MIKNIGMFFVSPLVGVCVLLPCFSRIIGDRCGLVRLCVLVNAVSRIVWRRGLFSLCAVSIVETHGYVAAGYLIV